MKEYQNVQNGNFGFTTLQLKKSMRGKFSRLKEKARFSSNTEKRRKKDKKRVQKYISISNSRRESLMNNKGSGKYALRKNV